MQVLIACHDHRTREPFLDALRRAQMSGVGAHDGATTLELARRHRPDVVFLDEEMPELAGLRGLERLAAEVPDARIVIIAGRRDHERGLRAILTGAAGWVSRETDPETLPRVVRAVRRGEAVIPRTLMKPLVELARGEAGMRPVRSPLTPREWEVLDLMSSGASSEQISNELVVSLETVQSHTKHILRKLGVHSRAAAIARAHELRRRWPESAGK